MLLLLASLLVLLAIGSSSILLGLQSLALLINELPNLLARLSVQISPLARLLLCNTTLSRHR